MTADMPSSVAVALRDTNAAERHGIARLLHLAAQEIQSGASPTPLKDTGGHVVGHYAFGRTSHDQRPRRGL
jgi:hypothetical protein